MKHLSIANQSTISNLFLYLLLLCMGMTMSRCEQDSDLKLPLAVNSNELNLTADGGSTHIMVYSTGKWTAAFKQEVNWASIDKLEGEGNSSVVFSYAENLGASRKVTLVLSTGEKVQEIVLVQAGNTPQLKFANTRPEIAKTALPVQLDLTTNLKYNLSDIQISTLYDDELSEQWITDARVTISGLEFQALENTTGSDRTVRVTLTLIDGNDKEYTTYADIKQTAADAFLTPEKTKTEVSKLATSEIVVLQTNVNNSMAYFTTAVNYASGGADWITHLVVKGNTMTFDIADNETGAPRAASINLKLENGNGEVINISYPVEQSETESSFIAFADIRAKISGATGEYTFTSDFDAMEGIVISEQGNMNLETNPQTVYNNVDWTENDKTVYIQSINGTYGFRIKTATVTDNTFQRYSKVNIKLNGLTLVKEANPTRYTLTGLTIANILDAESGTAANVIDKAKTISQLTDDDMYTFVRLINTEFSPANYNFFNVNGGYVVKSSWETAGMSNGAYVDCVPTAIRDNDKGTAYVLVNLKTPGFRTAIPTGSGSISGIITHSKFKRYGAGDGTIGRYFIRPLNILDIDMNNPALSNIIVEWNWYGASGVCSIAATPSISNITPAIGSGLMSCTKTATIGMGANFACIPADLGKVDVKNALTFGASWWNVAEDRGEGFIFQFSTAEKNGHSLAISFAQGGGSGSATTYHVPAYWQIEYSTDGTNYTVLPNSTYGVRPLPLWGADILFSCPGQQDHCFFLPDELLGQSYVYVKLVAQSNICGTNAKDGGEGGRITATENTGNVSVRFNSITFTYIPN
ncbi:MAG: hypothetical protein LBC40_08910 [Dysgonamonadaceae bacterium]|nr:hypothetical protein [Dysgonamonadaceae bacterium]